jgi:protein-S-isoprenylcysteine O-methyltransferase Ste14
VISGLNETLNVDLSAADLAAVVRLPLSTARVRNAGTISPGAPSAVSRLVLRTGYILVAIQLEERDLVDPLGDDYRRYRERRVVASKVRSAQ